MQQNMNDDVGVFINYELINRLFGDIECPECHRVVKVLGRGILSGRMECDVCRNKEWGIPRD